MTSTVLDVGLFLLCVSASVGTVTGVVPIGTDPDPHVDDLADRIATETATISYDTDAGHERRHHATLAEHLALAAIVPESESEDEIERRSERTYRDEVSAAVERRLDPRTAVTVRVPSAAEDSGSEDGGIDRRTAMAVGGEPPSTARVWTAVVDVPIGEGNATTRLVVRRWGRASV
ncbi:hypothetical protein SAMN05192561_101231 [Halopenitus malekzadehii]|uniref:Uncharacterized protein n=1 Tax=Halopenitus malekzadehii TaxID=1267564 RepID=A0A1H6HU27_9EURY|nr:hypothetical protein [Halopenitus malekzadehii]SEH37635.1 hypothetical protein SAMN05192561_101231 [Halopenitus malekzadehii]